MNLDGSNTPNCVIQFHNLSDDALLLVVFTALLVVGIIFELLLIYAFIKVIATLHACYVHKLIKNVSFAR